MLFPNITFKSVSIVFIQLFVLSVGSRAQEIFPFLIDGKYTLTDRNGVEIVSSTFDDVYTYQNIPLALVKLNETWGIVDAHGKWQVKPSMTDKVPGKRNEGIYFQPAFQKILETDSEEFLNVQLYRVNNTPKNQVYYIHPLIQQTNYTPYLAYENFMLRKLPRPPSPVITGLIKVVTLDTMVNFMDTTGRLIFEQSIYDGEAYAPNIIAVINKAGTINLFDRTQKPINSKDYSKVELTGSDNYLLCKNKQSSVQPARLSNDLYSKDGKIVLENIGHNFIAFRDFIIQNDDNGANIYSNKGDLIKSFPSCTLRTYDVEPDKIIIVKDKLHGIVNLKGEYVLEPKYSFLSLLNDSTYFYQSSTESGILNSQLKEQWSQDSVDGIKSLENLPGYYQVKKKRGNEYLYGIVDSRGKTIVPYEFDVVYFIKGWNIFSGHKASLRAIYDITGRIIFPLIKGEYEFDFDEGQIMVQTEDSVLTYNKRLELIDERDRFNTEFKLNKSGDVSYLVDGSGKRIYPYPIDNISRIQEMITGRWGYFVTRAKSSSDSMDVLSENGNRIIPPGYVFYTPGLQNAVGKIGPIVLTHKDDILVQEGLPRRGLIDLNGKWIIKPDYHRIGVLGNERIVTVKEGQLSGQLHNNSGEVINTNPYIYKFDYANRGINYNRMTVGYESGTSYYEDYLKKLGEKKLLQNVLIKKPKVMYGAIDRNGKEIIPVTYLEISDFEYVYTCAKGLEDNGEEFSTVIDLHGKELLHSANDLKYIFRQDTTLVVFQSGNRLGIVDLNGNVLVRPLYRDIEYHFNFFIVSDSINRYLIPREHLSSIYTIGKARFTEVTRLSENYLETRIKDFESKPLVTYVSVLDNEGLLKSQITAYDIKLAGQFGEGYYWVTPSEKSKPYLMDYRTGREFRKQ